MRSLRTISCLFFGLERPGTVYGSGGNFSRYTYFDEELGMGVPDHCVYEGGHALCQSIGFRVSVWWGCLHGIYKCSSGMLA